MAITTAGACVATESFDSDETAVMQDGVDPDLLRSPEGAEPAYSFVRPEGWKVVTDSIDASGNEGVVEVALLPPNVPAASLTVTHLDRASGGLEALTGSAEAALHGDVVRSRTATLDGEDALLHETRAPGGFRGRGAVVLRDGEALVVALTARSVNWADVAPALDTVVESWSWDPR